MEKLHIATHPGSWVVAAGQPNGKKRSCTQHLRTTAELRGVAGRCGRTEFRGLKAMDNGEAMTNAIIGKDDPGQVAHDQAQSTEIRPASSGWNATGSTRGSTSDPLLGPISADFCANPP
jgi:hypothetical protein